MTARMAPAPPLGASQPLSLDAVIFGHYEGDRLMYAAKTRNAFTRRLRLEFVEWTADNQLRHSRFVALREDKTPRKVIREKAGDVER